MIVSPIAPTTATSSVSLTERTIARRLIDARRPAFQAAR